MEHAFCDRSLTTLMLVLGLSFLNMKYRMLSFIAYPENLIGLLVKVMLRQNHRFMLCFGAGWNLLASII